MFECWKIEKKKKKTFFLLLPLMTAVSQTWHEGFEECPWQADSDPWPFHTSICISPGGQKSTQLFRKCKPQHNFTSTDFRMNEKCNFCASFVLWFEHKGKTHLAGHLRILQTEEHKFVVGHRDNTALQHLLVILVLNLEDSACVREEHYKRVFFHLVV